MAGLKAAMEQGGHIPVYMGSALKNVGIRQLMNGVNLLLPPPGPRRRPRTTASRKAPRLHHQNPPLPGYRENFPGQDLSIPPHLARLEGARFFRVFAESLEEIKDPAEIRAGDVVAIQSPQHYRMGQVLLSDGKADAGPVSGAF